jgi:hypothetical protein
MAQSVTGSRMAVYGFRTSDMRSRLMLGSDSKIADEKVYLGTKK